MEEVWVRVSGYENYYEVSNFGRVKSYHRYKEGKLLKFNKNHFGYLSVALIKNGQVKLTKVHRLVAKEFLKNPQNLPQVNHIAVKEEEIKLMVIFGNMPTQNKKKL